MTETPRRDWTLIITLLVSGFLGLLAAFSLTMDKFIVLQAKIDGVEAVLDCNFSVLVQCEQNLNSWQGAVFFGVPNPIWGLMGWVAPIAVAVALIAGARLRPWFWWLFNLGHAAALGFCIWLMGQSIFVLGTLCVWCMLTWSVAILSFWVITGRNLAAGRFGSWGMRLGRFLSGWWPALTIFSYLIVALIAQVRLDWLATL